MIILLLYQSWEYNFLHFREITSSQALKEEK